MPAGLEAAAGVFLHGMNQLLFAPDGALLGLNHSALEVHLRRGHIEDPDGEVWDALMTMEQALMAARRDLAQRGKQP